MIIVITLIALNLAVLALATVAVISQRRLAALRAKHEMVCAFARDIAEDMHYDHYRKTAPEWQVAHDPMEILSQISNMAMGLMVKEPLRQWRFVEQAYDKAKTSTCERLLADLGLPVTDAAMPLSWHINRVLPDAS